MLSAIGALQVGARIAGEAERSRRFARKRSRPMAQPVPVGVLDLHVPIVQPAEPEGAEVHVPDTVVDLLQSDVLADAHGGHVDPR